MAGYGHSISSGCTESTQSGAPSIGRVSLIPLLAPPGHGRGENKLRHTFLPTLLNRYSVIRPVFKFLKYECERRVQDAGNDAQAAHGSSQQPWLCYCKCADHVEVLDDCG